MGSIDIHRKRHKSVDIPQRYGRYDYHKLRPRRARPASLLLLLLLLLLLIMCHRFVVSYLFLVVVLILKWVGKVCWN